MMSGMTKVKTPGAKDAKSQEKYLQEKVAKLRAGEERKKEGERRAHAAVLQLMEPGVSSQLLSDLARVMQPCHYADVVDERHADSLCGYPLCCNAVKHTSQKYHVSTSSNRVYDVTERKKFCSSGCFEASRHYAKQIPSSPLWVRDKEPRLLIVLRDHTRAKGRPGEAVVLRPGHELAEEVRRLTEQDRREESSAKRLAARHKHIDTASRDRAPGLSKESTSSGEAGKSEAGDQASQSAGTKPSDVESAVPAASLSSVIANVERINLMTSYDADSDDDDDVIHSGGRGIPGEGLSLHVESREGGKLNDGVEERVKEEGKSKEDEMEGRLKGPEVEGGLKGEAQEGLKDNDSCGSNKQEVTLTIEQDLFVKTMAIMREWISEETVSLLKRSKTDILMGTDVDAKLVALANRKVAEDLDSDDDDDGDGEGKRGRDPMPGYDALRKEVEEFDLRVQEFYRPGSNAANAEKKKGGEKEEDDSDDRQIVLPVVDKHGQTAIRRTVVLKAVTKVMAEYLRPLRASLADVGPDLRALVHTFRLTASNVALKPAERKVMSFYVLLLLSSRLASIKEGLEEHLEDSVFCSVLTMIASDYKTVASALDECLARLA